VIAVISEVWPYPERRSDYFRLAEELLPSLHAIDGFISSERLESTAEPGKYISLSFWRDEAALSAWRNLVICPTYSEAVLDVIRNFRDTYRGNAPESVPISV